MNFEELKDFIQNKMRMAHIYQPVMLKTLLKNGGKSSVKKIAGEILSNDESQIEYYENITRSMVGRVLTNHNIVSRDKSLYKLNNFERFNQEEINELIQICDQKLLEYIDKRGKKIWQHRRKSSGYISGTLKYEILKEAKFHCELCGIPADEKALEIDHIIPRNRGGTDDSSNLQALCYSCNSMKRDLDDTDFRKIRISYKNIDEDCLFCKISKERLIMKNNLAFAIRDKYPATEMHSLVIPKRHVNNYFQLSQPEINSCNKLLLNLKNDIINQDDSVEGFNIGINNGTVAGQTINHCHIHLIPRRKNDVKHPKGGIRHLIPGKGEY